jgi:hypothetical protein
VGHHSANSAQPPQGSWRAQVGSGWAVSAMSSERGNMWVRRAPSASSKGCAERAADVGSCSSGPAARSPCCGSHSHLRLWKRTASWGHHCRSLHRCQVQGLQGQVGSPTFFRHNVVAKLSSDHCDAWIPSNNNRPSLVIVCHRNPARLLFSRNGSRSYVAESAWLKRLVI